MIKCIVAALSALTIMTASAAHVVLDNGETRLIKDDEQVFIVKKNKRLWFLGKKAQPLDLGEAEVVVTPPPPVVDDGPAEGSREWCEAFDTSGDYSFDSQTFDRVCDTSGDGEYNYCEDYVPYQNGFTFEDQDYIRECQS